MAADSSQVTCIKCGATYMEQGVPKKCKKCGVIFTKLIKYGFTVSGRRKKAQRYLAESKGNTYSVYRKRQDKAVSRAFAMRDNYKR